MIYLDANATSPVLPAAAAAAQQALATDFGNPSSSHAFGLRARAVLDATRACARRVLGAPSGRLLFTSGATEGIQTAVLSALVAARARGLRDALLVYGATEHKAVPQALAHWNAILGTGFELVALPVDSDGRHRLDVLRELAPRAALVCTMAANNETGVVSDLDGIGAALDGSDALWLVDGVQALGKLALDLSATRIDYAPFSGHKLYAPKGIGMLYVREGAPFTALIAGGGQEEGQRSGTENMAGIAALGAVLAALEAGSALRSPAALQACRARLEQALRAALPGMVLNTPPTGSLPTTLNFSVPGLSSGEIVDVFDAAGIQVSAGSACSAAGAAPSYVLAAMGLPAWRAASAVRLSFGPAASDAFIEQACARIAHAGRALAAPRLAGAQGLGLMQLGAAPAHGWLLFDEASRAAVLIDPPSASDAGALLAAEGYTLLATLASADRAPGAVQLGQHRIEHDGASYRCGAARLADLAVGSGAAAAIPGLTQATLDAFFAAHPDALLVDVRESREQAAGAPSLGGRVLQRAPLTRLAEHAPLWLRQPAQALVFVCRSGRRSATAAATLRRLGHRAVYHLEGGLAASW